MEPQRNQPKRESPRVAMPAPEIAALGDVERLVPTAADHVADELPLPPVWIRLPDVGPDESDASETETLVTEADACDSRKWPSFGRDNARQGSSLVTVAAVAILLLTLYLVLPGRERARSTPPDNGPPPAWDSSPAAGPWRGPTAESLPAGEAPPTPPDDQTAGTPADDAVTAPDQRLGAVPPWRITPADQDHWKQGRLGQARAGLAELDGTIETNTLHRARREPPDASLY